MGFVVVTAMVVGMVAGGTAVASHSFPDVPDSHPFHSEISWLVAAGVTEGYPDGTYRPSQPVTRGSMAAFMQRLAQSEPVEPRVWHATRPTAASVSGVTGAPELGLHVVTVPSLPAGTYEVTVSALLSATADRVVACDFTGSGAAGNVDVLSMPPTLETPWATADVTPQSVVGTAVVDLAAPGSLVYRCWKVFGLSAPYPAMRGNMVVEAVRDL
jgi:hypothetical protein